MNRNQRLLMLAHGGGSSWDLLCARAELVFSADARSKYRRYVSVSAVLRSALQDPDDLVIVSIGRPGLRNPKQLTTAVLLAVLSIIVVVEWKSYTLPALAEWILFIAHQCGMR